MYKLSPKQQGVLFLLITALTSGSSYLLADESRKLLNPENSLFFWLFSAFVASLLYVLIRGQTRQLFTRESILSFFFIGGANALFGIIYFQILDDLGTNATSFYFRLSVVFVVLLSWLFLKEKFNKPQLLGVVIAIVGSLILSFSAEISLSGAALLAVLATFFGAAADVLAKVVVKKVSPGIISTSRLAGSSLFSLIYLLLFNTIQVPSARALALTGIGGILTSFVGHLFFYAALKRIKLSHASIITNLNPVVTISLNLLIFGIFPSALKLLGGVLLMAGAVIIGYWSISTRSKQTEEDL